MKESKFEEIDVSALLISERNTLTILANAKEPLLINDIHKSLVESFLELLLSEKQASFAKENPNFYEDFKHITKKLAKELREKYTSANHLGSYLNKQYGVKIPTRSTIEKMLKDFEGIGWVKSKTFFGKLRYYMPQEVKADYRRSLLISSA